MAEEINKLYSGITDDAMLTGAETMRDLFEDDQGGFETFDAAFSDAFKTAWDGKIDEARDMPSDESVNDEITELTEAVNDAWDACKVHFQDSKYFIEKAFTSKAKQNKFGFDDYRAMSRDQDKVLPFMDQFHDEADTNKIALIAAGYTQAKIDAIETLAAAFRTANRAQEKAKKDRLSTTQERIEKMNAVWRVLQQVNKASKSVFRTNPAKLQAYFLPGPGTNEGDDSLSVRGKATHVSTNAPLPDVTVSLPEHDLTTTTDDNGNFAFAVGIEAGSTPITATATGFINFSDAVTVTEGELVTKNIKLTPV